MTQSDIASKLYNNGEKVYTDSFGDTFKCPYGAKRFPSPMNVEVAEDTFIEVYGVFINKEGQVELDTTSTLEPTENGWEVIGNAI